MCMRGWVWPRFAGALSTAARRCARSYAGGASVARAKVSMNSGRGGRRTRLALANLPKTAAKCSTSFASVSSPARLQRPFQGPIFCAMQASVVLCFRLPLNIEGSPFWPSAPTSVHVSLLTHYAEVKVPRQSTSQRPSLGNLIATGQLKPPSRGFGPMEINILLSTLSGRSRRYRGHVPVEHSAR